LYIFAAIVLTLAHTSSVEEAVGNRCRLEGKESGWCDRNAYTEDPDTCDTCKRGSRWSGVGIFGSHWCCTEEDVRDHGDCECYQKGLYNWNWAEEEAMVGSLFDAIPCKECYKKDSSGQCKADIACLIKKADKQTTAGELAVGLGGTSHEGACSAEDKTYSCSTIMLNNIGAYCACPKHDSSYSRKHAEKAVGCSDHWECPKGRYCGLNGVCTTVTKRTAEDAVGCPPFKCRMYCENGFAKKSGCPVCACKRAENTLASRLMQQDEEAVGGSWKVGRCKAYSTVLERDPSATVALMSTGGSKTDCQSTCNADSTAKVCQYDYSGKKCKKLTKKYASYFSGDGAVGYYCYAK